MTQNEKQYYFGRWYELRRKEQKRRKGEMELVNRLSLHTRQSSIEENKILVRAE